MSWSEKEPKSGDIIRTRVSFYYHYGIFVNEGEIIQFGLPDNICQAADSVKVLSSDIYTFLNGGELETLVPDRSLRKIMNSPCVTVQNARARIGEGGYNVQSNNCEHFVVSCAFKESRDIE